MKTITAKDKEEFKKINELLKEMDDELQAYIMGYSHGLCEGKRLPLRGRKNGRKKK